ncbi:hypothetical protein ACOME3_006088 [Neoechinorhynchus agilis]
MVTYISFDIIRRILEDYFGYNVIYTMNITDIDDKIIKRARERYLLDQYAQAGHSSQRVINDINEALKHLEHKLSIEEDFDKRDMMGKMILKARDKLCKVSTSQKSSNCSQGRELSSFSSAGPSESWNKELILSSDFADILADSLDFKHGHNVTDNQIFTKLPRKYESEFHADMKALNIRPPSVLTRVSEYVDEIIDFVKMIDANGYAYRSPKPNVVS